MICSGVFEGNPRERTELLSTQYLNEPAPHRQLQMNNQSPLVPQGTLLDQKNKGRKRIEIAVFVVLAIHGMVMFGFLMAGCQKPPESGTAEGSTNTPPAFVAP